MDSICVAHAFFQYHCRSEACGESHIVNLFGRVFEMTLLFIGVPEIRKEPLRG
jgi:hypothetical protein